MIQVTMITQKIFKMSCIKAWNIFTFNVASFIACRVIHCKNNVSIYLNKKIQLRGTFKGGIKYF